MALGAQRGASLFTHKHHLSLLCSNSVGIVQDGGVVIFRAKAVAAGGRGGLTDWASDELYLSWMSSFPWPGSQRKKKVNKRAVLSHF